MLSGAVRLAIKKNTQHSVFFNKPLGLPFKAVRDSAGDTEGASVPRTISEKMMHKVGHVPQRPVDTTYYKNTMW